MLVHHALLVPLVLTIATLCTLAHQGGASLLVPALIFMTILLVRMPSKHMLIISTLCASTALISYYHQHETITPKTLPVSIGCVMAKTDRYATRWREQLEVRLSYPDHTRSLMCFSARRTPLQPGDIILLSDITISPGTPDLIPWLHKNSLGGFVFLDDHAWRLLIHRSPPLCTRVKNHIYHAITSKLSPHTRELFSLVFLGREHKKNGAVALRHACMFWGISHYLARSGLHVTLLLVLWSLPLLLVRSLRIRHALLLCILICYALLSWSSVSFMRALLVGTFGYIGTCSHRPTHAGFLLAASCLALLIYNPFELFFLGFQLTYAFTLGASLYFLHVTNRRHRH